ncbi:hypothetical protein PLICRDRAFT_180506 [Plicaturopsis crispa FD-325 SS-3]|uniref:Ribonuclease H1 N-terminal domain-containing protein n=1 Tax=Plicaturopsis crispa FD-325 SS-3 TaxID=944288 RepID=A0A0C9SQ76_PLICR|nr:hypothetical protein PLICRDRAFT_180506 [Plicaturopsis crispa FD-325 SS-3]
MTTNATPLAIDDPRFTVLSDGRICCRPTYYAEPSDGKLYLICVGRQPGIYRSWTKAGPTVLKFSGAVHHIVSSWTMAMGLWATHCIDHHTHDIRLRGGTVMHRSPTQHAVVPDSSQFVSPTNSSSPPVPSEEPRHRQPAAEPSSSSVQQRPATIPPEPPATPPSTAIRRTARPRVEPPSPRELRPNEPRIYYVVKTFANAAVYSSRERALRAFEMEDDEGTDPTLFFTESLNDALCVAQTED